MNRQTDRERLIDDLIAGEADGFREQSLKVLLQSAQRRRQMRVVRGVGVAMAALAAIATVAWFWMIPRQPASLVADHSSEQTACDLVNTTPLLPEQIVTTFSLSQEQTVNTGFGLRIVQTFPGNIHEVGDEELLTLALPRIAALVRRGPDQAELVFVSDAPGVNNN